MHAVITSDDFDCWSHFLFKFYYLSAILLLELTFFSHGMDDSSFVVHLYTKSATFLLKEHKDLAVIKKIANFDLQNDFVMHIQNLLEIDTYLFPSPTSS